MDQNLQNDFDAVGYKAPLLKTRPVDASAFLEDEDSPTITATMSNPQNKAPTSAAIPQPGHGPRHDSGSLRETDIKHKGQPETRLADGGSWDYNGMPRDQPNTTSRIHKEDRLQALPVECPSTSELAREPGKQGKQGYQGLQNNAGRAPSDAKYYPDQEQGWSPSEGARSPGFGTRPESLLTSPLTHPNGVSMFPELSTSEQEHISREALDQASESIVADSADSIDTRIDDDDSDGGYDSDGFSSASTSAESSIRDYMYENGRRYHRFREGSYNFPNDDVEQEREDMKHAMVKLLCSQKLHFAPIGDNPQEILDIGTGTGIWPIEMGDQYPSAHILGIDLSPIQPDWLPPNVRFLVDDVESPWLHPRNHFDYIHSRHTVMAVRDWMKLFRRSMEHLKPGGWIELQEIHHSPLSAHPEGGMPSDHPVAQFWSKVTEGLETLGVDLNASSGGKLANMMHQVGFTNVTERVLHVPIGTWPKNKVLKTVGLYWRTILLDGLQAIALGPLTRGLGWNREEVEVFLMNVRQAHYDNASLMYMPLHIIYAQKPVYSI